MKVFVNCESTFLSAIWQNIKSPNNFVFIAKMKIYQIKEKNFNSTTKLSDALSK